MLKKLIERLRCKPEPEQEEAIPSAHAWWKEAVFYQAGKEIKNEIKNEIRLDYFEALGVDALIVDSIPRDAETDIKFIAKYGTENADGFMLEIDINDPQIHTHLQGLLGDFLMAEVPEIDISLSRKLTDSYRNELNLVVRPPVALAGLKNFCIKHLNADCGHGWNTLVLNRQDAETIPIAKMLALLQFTLRGSPLIYQGEELGKKGTEFSWEEADKQELDATSMLSFYRDLIALRRSAPALIYGALTFLNQRDKNFLSFSRILSLSSENFYIEANLKNKGRRSKAPESAEFLLGNYGTPGGKEGKLKPYEARIYKLTN